MTPKEKAKELFKSMYNKIFDIDTGANVMQDKKRFDAAKQCALITVSEVTNGNFSDGYDHAFWEQVKAEIEKL